MQKKNFSFKLHLMSSIPFKTIIGVHIKNLLQKALLLIYYDNFNEVFLHPIIASHIKVKKGDFIN